MVLSSLLTLFIEHIGLIPAQLCQERREHVTSFMRPAPYPSDNEIGSPDDDAVADTLADSTLNLWFETARKNREIFTEIFRPVPTNLVRDWGAYDVGVPCFLSCHRNFIYIILWIELRSKDQDRSC